MSGLESRAKNAGVDLAFAKQLQRLEQVKALVESGAVKPEVYQKLEDQVFKVKEKPPPPKPSINHLGRPKQQTFARKLIGKKKSPTEKFRDREGAPKNSSKTSRTGSSTLLRDRASSILSVLSERAKSTFKTRNGDNILLEAPLMKFSKVRGKKKWTQVYTILYTDRVEFKKSKEAKTGKTFRLNEDWFVSTVDEKGAKRVVQRAAEDDDTINSEDEENIERINESLQGMDEIKVMKNVFVIASLSYKKSTKILLACEDDQQRELWVAMTCEVIRDLRQQAEYDGNERTMSRKGWKDINSKAKKFAQARLGKELDKSISEIDHENIDKQVDQWEHQGKKAAKKQFLQEWRSREAQRMRQQNKKLKEKLVKKEEEFTEFKQQTKKALQQVQQENKEKLAQEKKKNAELNKKYDELMEKYRAEAYARNMDRKNDEARIKKRIKALQRRSIMPHSEEARHYKEQLEAYKQKLATLQKALKIDLDEMDWDGSLEQAEQRMQECLKDILEGATPQIQAKAQQDFDKWDQLVRGHSDFIAREENKWKDWEEENKEKNLAARDEMREKFVPEEFRQGCSVKKLMELKGMKEKVARRIFKNKIFKFLWMEKAAIAKIHGAALTNDYASQGLDLRELRAIYASLPEEFDADNDGRKKQFRDTMRSTLYNLTEKQRKGTILPKEELHNDYRDKPVANHIKPANLPPRAPRPKVKVNSAIKGNAAKLEAFFGAKKAPPAGGSTRGNSSKSSNSFDAADPKWKKYFGMQKRNLPDQAIEQKMVMDGEDPKLWAKLKKAKETSSSSKPKPAEELNPKAPEFKTYFRMQANGLEDGAIRNKMVMDGKDPALWDKLVAKTKKAEAAAPSKAPEPNKPLDPDDPIWAEYFKMRKLRLAEGQIMNKMQKDGKDPALWSKLVALKEKQEQRSKSAVITATADEFELLTAEEPKAAPKLLKPKAAEEPKNDSGDIDEDLKRAMSKRKSKAKKPVQYDEFGQPIKRKKKKKKSKSVTGEVGERRRSERNKRHSSKGGHLLLLQKDAGDLVSLAKKGLDLETVGKSRKSGRHIDIMDYGENTQRGGRRKTLRKSKVGTAALKGDTQLQEVVDYILTDGEDDEKGNRVMKFGDVFDNFVEISDILVGILLKGKKSGQLRYKGDMLFKGIHDEVKITVV